MNDARTDAGTAISVRGIEKSFKDLHVLRGVDFEVGKGSISPSETLPVQVGTATNWSKVALATASTCGVDTSGKLWCWGDNESGQIGNGSRWRTLPTLVSK